MNRKKSLLLLSAVALGTTIYNLIKPVKSKVTVIDNFEKEKYLGTWCEIARLDFFWEKNLDQVKAEYSLNEDGSIQVKNSGFHTIKQKERQRIGKATFADNNETKGALKVSFFGPFSGGYHIVQLDEDYKYALIFGDNLDYLWIISRETTIPDHIKEQYLTYAQNHGYDVTKLVWTKQV